jgi:hypothetical protein
MHARLFVTRHDSCVSHAEECGWDYYEVERVTDGI